MAKKMDTTGIIGIYRGYIGVIRVCIREWKRKWKLL